MQTAATEFAEVLKFRFDADIEAADGEAGRLAAVVADPATRAITHAVVKTRPFFGATCFVPLRLVTGATADTVSISVSLAEIEKMSAQPDGIPLNTSTSVTTGRKPLGRLRQITVNHETRAPRHLVIERRGQEALVPAAMIASIAVKQISVDLGEVNPAQLVSYRPDEELHQEVYDAIYDYPRLRVDLPGIVIHAIDGVVWLRGYVASDLSCRLVSDQLGGIVGLAELHNELIADNQLAAAVSMALGRDPRTAGEPIGVYPRLGTVHLRGNARSVAARQAAGEIARAVPGVKAVVNELHLDPRAEVVPVLASVTNEEDRIPGGP